MNFDDEIQNLADRRLVHENTRRDVEEQIRSLTHQKHSLDIVVAQLQTRINNAYTAKRAAQAAAKRDEFEHATPENKKALYFTALQHLLETNASLKVTKSINRWDHLSYLNIDELWPVGKVERETGDIYVKNKKTEYNIVWSNAGEVRCFLAVGSCNWFCTHFGTVGRVM